MAKLWNFRDDIETAVWGTKWLLSGPILRFFHRVWLISNKSTAISMSSVTACATLMMIFRCHSSLSPNRLSIVLAIAMISLPTPSFTRNHPTPMATDKNLRWEWRDGEVSAEFFHGSLQLYSFGGDLPLLRCRQDQWQCRFFLKEHLEIWWNFSIHQNPKNMQNKKHVLLFHWVCIKRIVGIHQRPAKLDQWLLLRMLHPWRDQPHSVTCHSLSDISTWNVHGISPYSCSN